MAISPPLYLFSASVPLSIQFPKVRLQNKIHLYKEVFINFF